MVVPDVVLSPHVDADAQVVMAAADHVEGLLPRSGNGTVPPFVERRGFTMREHLDPITYEQMKALMRAVI